MNTMDSRKSFTCRVKKHAHIKDVLGAIVGVYILAVLATFLHSVGVVFYSLIFG